MKKLLNKGFTIIELLIAILIFSTVLLLCLEGITRISKIYIKNSSISRTNQFIRSLTDEISRQIKYGASSPAIDDRTGIGYTNPTFRYCISGSAYKVSFNKITDAILRKSDPNCNSFSDPINDYFSTGAENVAPSKMRVLNFEISEDSIRTISMRVALGENDLLEDNDGNELGDSTTKDNYSKAKCRLGIAGSEFCAVLELTTSATPRMSE